MPPATIRDFCSLRLPGASSCWMQFYGAALLTGIGFTMSLVIGTLAFPDPDFAAPVRIGALTGSLPSAAGAVVPLPAPTNRPEEA